MKEINLILHPGYPKCGSSSIQSFLYSNINELHKQEIFILDQNFTFGQKKHNNFSDRFFSNLIRGDYSLNEFEDKLKQLIEYINESQFNSVLISHEGIGLVSNNSLIQASCKDLSSQAKMIEKIQKINDCFASYFKSRKIILYIRRQDDFFLSAWKQWGFKRNQTLKEYIDQLLEFHQPNFLETINFLENCYGKNNIVIIPLTNKAFYKGELIKDFCFQAGLNISEELKSELKKNQSLNPYLCDILSRIDNFFTTTTDNDIKRLLINSIHSNQILYKNDPNIISPEQRNIILDEFEEDNRILHQKYFNHIPYEYFIDRNAYLDNQVEKNTEYELEKLKDVVAIQMELIIKLLKEQEKKSYFSQKLSNLQQKIAKILHKNK